MTRTSSYHMDEIISLSKHEARKREIRTRARDNLRASTLPSERHAVAMAEAGYGIERIVMTTNVSHHVASLLVRGE